MERSRFSFPGISRDMQSFFSVLRMESQGYNGFSIGQVVWAKSKKYYHPAFFRGRDEESGKAKVAFLESCLNIRLVSFEDIHALGENDFSFDMKDVEEAIEAKADADVARSRISSYRRRQENKASRPVQQSACSTREQQHVPQENTIRSIPDSTSSQGQYQDCTTKSVHPPDYKPGLEEPLNYSIRPAHSMNCTATSPQQLNCMTRVVQPLNYVKPALPNFTEPAPAHFTEPAPPNFTGPAPSNFTGPAPPNFTGPAPPNFTGPAPPNFTGPSPPNYTGPAPPNFTGPAPPNFTGPTQPNFTRPAPLNFTASATPYFPEAPPDIASSVPQLNCAVGAPPSMICASNYDPSLNCSSECDQPLDYTTKSLQPPNCTEGPEQQLNCTEIENLNQNESSPISDNYSCSSESEMESVMDDNVSVTSENESDVAESSVVSDGNVSDFEDYGSPSETEQEAEIRKQINAEFGKAVGALSEEKASEVVETILSGSVDRDLLFIKDCSVYSARHIAYEEARQNRDKRLMYENITSLIVDENEQLKIADYLELLYKKCFRRLNRDYVNYVWYPEAIDIALELINIRNAENSKQIAIEIDSDDEDQFCEIIFDSYLMNGEYEIGSDEVSINNAEAAEINQDEVDEDISDEASEISSDDVYESSDDDCVIISDEEFEVSVQVDQNPLPSVSQPAVLNPAPEMPKIGLLFQLSDDI